jgi:PAS domain S-box-containing protein
MTTATDASNCDSFRAIVDQVPVGVMVQCDERVVYANRAALDCLGFARATDVLGRQMSDLLDPDSYATLASNFHKSGPDDDQLFMGELKMRRKAGALIDAEVYHAGLRFEGVDATLINFRDITLTKKLELELRQAQKLESIGRLAAGVAHEINTPIQYIGDNANYLSQAIDELLNVLEQSRAALRELTEKSEGAAAASRLDQAEEAADLDYLRAEGPRAIAGIIEGVRRVSRVVGAMKSFSHPGTESTAPMDVNKIVEDTLVIAAHELRTAAEVKTDLGTLPPVRGFAADMNQALLNLVVNAAHAIADRPEVREPGVVSVRTRYDQGQVTITVTDNGCGMSDAVQARLFEPFFTTKDVGRGTGQGLVLVRAAALKHNGTLTHESSVGVGTRFTLSIPLDPEIGAALAEKTARPSQHLSSHDAH